MISPYFILQGSPKMRMNLPVTEHERTFPGDQRLISTTDLGSRITYCNDAFLAISGFTSVSYTHLTLPTTPYV